MAKKKTVSQLKKLADKYFSIYIRKRDAGKCFTCPNRKPWKQMQAGHFVSRSHSATRFDEMNVHCQDYACNYLRRGNYHIYSQNLIKKYGLKKFNDLVNRGKKIYQFTTKELEEIIEKYKKYE